MVQICRNNTIVIACAIIEPRVGDAVSLFTYCLNAFSTNLRTCAPQSDDPDDELAMIQKMFKYVDPGPTVAEWCLITGSENGVVGSRIHFTIQTCDSYGIKQISGADAKHFTFHPDIDLMEPCSCSCIDGKGLYRVSFVAKRAGWLHISVRTCCLR